MSDFSVVPFIAKCKLDSAFPHGQVIKPESLGKTKKVLEPTGEETDVLRKCWALQTRNLLQTCIIVFRMLAGCSNCWMVRISIFMIVLVRD